MLQAHLNAVEQHLLQISKIPANSGHSLHKGTPRESFIKEFLVNHLSEQVAIGTGEIIDANSKPNETRNQIDIVIYKRNYPKIDFGGGVNGFFAESVVATIEVKSTLTKEDLRQATKTARNVKRLQRSITTGFTSGYQPPSILNYVVAYDGPANVETILGWIPEIHEELSIDPIPLISTTDRLKIPSPSLDGIFVLGKGFIYFDNSPLTLERTTSSPEFLIQWCCANTSKNNLFLLFMFLTMALSGSSDSRLNPKPYVSSSIVFEPGELLTLGVWFRENE